MMSLRRILVLLLSGCVLSRPTFARQPNPGFYEYPPIPSDLQGVWAKGRHCGDPERQLHVTKRTMQFGTKPPVWAFYFSLSDSFRQERGIVPDADSPAFAPAMHALTYDNVDGSDVLFDYGNAGDPEKIYYRCLARKPRNP